MIVAASSFPALFLVVGLLLCAGMAWIVALRRRVRSAETARQRAKAELSSAKEQLTELSRTLLKMEREVARLKRIPKAELLPMLQLTHELRSPLAAIVSALEIVLQGYAVSNPQLHDEMLVLAQDRARNLLGRVNDFMRLGAVKYAEIERTPRPVQISDILQRLIPELQVRARWEAVNLEIVLPDQPLPPVAATKEDIDHLLSNLVNIAIKYTYPGGTVTVTLQEKDGDVVGVVTDTGIGIAADELPHIFDEFYRAKNAQNKAAGTGLGLSIVKRIVDLYGGQIKVESEPGKGSRFTFSFPALASASQGNG